MAQLEAKLIAEFEKYMQTARHTAFGLSLSLNFGDDNDDFADVEYVANNGERIALEAKTTESGDMSNGVHKIFGLLLKESGKNRPVSTVLGILINEDIYQRKKKGIDYYRDRFHDIDPNVFNDFGTLVDAKYVFVFSESNPGVKVFSWFGYYASAAPISF